MGGTLKLSGRTKVVAAEAGAFVVRYHIWSHEHCMWWRGNHSGYTEKLSEAGSYTHSEAADITMDHTPAGEEVAVDTRFADREEGQLRKVSALLVPPRKWSKTSDVFDGAATIRGCVQELRDILEEAAAKRDGNPTDFQGIEEQLAEIDHAASDLQEGG